MIIVNTSHKISCNLFVLHMVPIATGKPGKPGNLKKKKSPGREKTWNLKKNLPKTRKNVFWGR